MFGGWSERVLTYECREDTANQDEYRRDDGCTCGAPVIHPDTTDDGEDRVDQAGTTGDDSVLRVYTSQSVPAFKR